MDDPLKPVTVGGGGWRPGVGMRAVLRLQQIDKRDVESSSEGTYPTILLGFVLINAAIAGCSAPVVAHLLYPGTTLPVLVPLGVLAFCFIFLVDLLIVSVLPQPWVESIAVRVGGAPLRPVLARLRPNRTRNLSPNVLVPPMPGALARSALLAPRVLITLPLAFALGTGLNVVFTLADIRNEIRQDADHQSQVLKDEADATWLSDRQDLRDEVTAKQETVTAALTTYDAANLRVKCESGEVSGPACAGIATGGGGKGLQDAQGARDIAIKALNAANKGLRRAQRALRKHNAEGRPSKAPGFDADVETSGLGPVIRAYKVVIGSRGFLGQYGFDLLMLLLDLTPLAFKLLKGWSDSDERRWRRRHIVLWREARALQKESDEDKVREAEREAELVAARSPGVRQAVAQRIEATARRANEAADLEGRLHLDELDRQRRLSALRADEAVRDAEHAARLAELDREHAQQKHEFDLAAAAAEWGSNQSSNHDHWYDGERAAHEAGPHDIAEDDGALGHDRQSEGTQATPIWESDDLFHGPRGRFETHPPADSAWFESGADLWIVGPDITAVPGVPGYGRASQNPVHLAVRYFGGAQGERQQVDPVRDVRAVKLLSKGTADYESKLLKKFEPHSLRPEGNPVEVMGIEQLHLRADHGEPRTHALVFNYHPRTDVLRYWRARGSAAHGAVTWGDFAQWITDTAKGVSMIWREGYVLNDLKPANMLATGHYPGLPGSEPATSPYTWHSGLLIDFAAVRRADPARRVADDPEPASFEATPAYLAPELASGGPVVGTFESDAFSLGSSMIKLATGLTPRQWLEQELGSPSIDAYGYDSYSYAAYVTAGRLADKLPHDMPAPLRKLALRLVSPDPAQRLSGGRLRSLRPREAGPQLERMVADAVRTTVDTPLPVVEAALVDSVVPPSGWSEPILRFIQMAGLEVRIP